MNALATLVSANTCFRNGEVVRQDALRTIAPMSPEGDTITTSATLREFVDQHFFPLHKIKLAILGQSNGVQNGSEITFMAREAGYSVGKKEVAFFDKRIGGFVADWVNCYPVDVLWTWVEGKTDGSYMRPAAA